MLIKSFSQSSSKYFLRKLSENSLQLVSLYLKSPHSPKCLSRVTVLLLIKVVIFYSVAEPHQIDAAPALGQKF
jgi:hypothetical protein